MTDDASKKDFTTMSMSTEAVTTTDEGFSPEKSDPIATNKADKKSA